jgi:hypothetical protein
MRKTICTVAEVPSYARTPIELVAIDLDGTLLRSDKQLTVRTARTIADVARRGVRVVLASARPPRSVREIYHHLSLDTLQMNYNGALIWDPPAGRHVFHQPLSPQVARTIVDLARQIDRDIQVDIELLDRWLTDRVHAEPATETARYFKPDHVAPLAQLLVEPVTKLMLVGQREKLSRVRDAVHRVFGRQVAILVSDDHLIQIVHPQVDKGRALAWIANAYGIQRESVMAIGDAPNDVGMLQWAGLGAAMENGWDAARQVADVIVPSNDDEGVDFALKRYVLPHLN